MEVLIWFILGACAMLAAIVLGGILAVVVGLTDTLLTDEHYVD